MQQPKQLNNERVYALDALRGIMMVLGIVIHAAITYGKIDYGTAWSLKDTNSNQTFFDYLVSFIHVFRMPVFMVAMVKLFCYFYQAPWGRYYFFSFTFFLKCRPDGALLLLSFYFLPKYRLYEAVLTCRSTPLFGAITIKISTGIHQSISLT